MIIKDDRTEEQKRTHRWAVVATDRFLSGWGGAEGGSSFAAWACERGDLYDVERWVRSRSDMQRVRVANLDTYRPSPRTCAHYHIYTVTPGHGALAGR